MNVIAPLEPRRTIGEGWSDDPAEKARQIEAQERLVSEMCDLADLIEEWELDG